MAMRHIEGFDYFGVTADIALKYQGSTIALSTTTRYGVGKSAGSNGTLEIIIDAQATWIIGAAVHYFGGSAGAYIGLVDGSTIHANLYFNTDGSMLIRRGTTTIVTIPGNLSEGWHFIEFKCLIADAAGAGTVVVKVDGTVWYTNPGALDTRNAGNASADRIRFLLPSSSLRIDDLHIMDGTDGTATQGAAYNDFIGDKRVYCYTPNAAGNYTQGTPVGAATIAETLDELAEDGDTTYTYLASGEMFTSNLIASPAELTSPLCYCIDVLSRKDDAGTVTIRAVERQNSTDRTNTGVNLGDSYAYISPTLRFTMPDASAITTGKLDSLEIGVERTN